MVNSETSGWVLGAKTGKEVWMGLKKCEQACLHARGAWHRWTWTLLIDHYKIVSGENWEKKTSRGKESTYKKKSVKILKMSKKLR